MSFGHPRSRYGLNSFNACMRELKSMQNPIKGRLIANNTRLWLAEGTMDDPKRIDVSLYRSTIVRFHRDGALDVLPSYHSSTTFSRISAHCGVNFCYRPIPPINGYKPVPEKATFMGFGSQSWNGFAVAATNGPNEFVRLNGEDFDLKTVNPYRVQVVSRPKELRKVMLHLGKYVKLLEGYAKLKGDDDLKGRMDARSWLFERIGKDHCEAGISPLPMLHVGQRNRAFGANNFTTIRSEMRKSLNWVRHEIARKNGWLEEKEIYSVG